MDTEKLLKTLKQYRKSMHLTQGELAARAGMSTSFYGMLELGKRRMTIDYLNRITEGLECSPLDLMIMAEEIG